MSTLVVAETVADVVEFNVAASEDAVIEVSQTVSTTDGHVVQRAVEAFFVGFAATIMFLANTLAADDAVIGIGLAINTANRFVEVSRALAAFVGIARTIVSKLDFLASHEAGVLVGDTVFSTDWSSGDIVTRAATTILAESSAFALETAVVIVFLALSAANWSDGTRAVVALIVVGRAGTVVSLSEALALQQAFIIVGDAVLATNRSISV